MTTQRSLLAIFAHPDDEAIGFGGVMAHYAAAGVRVDLVCATRGEEGEIAIPSLVTPKTLGPAREKELRCAAAVMGLNELIFLGYRDSGMAGAAANEDPRAFVNAPAYQVVAQLVEIIRRLRPQLIVTFEPNGGYGHPDHVTTHHHTVAAFTAAAALNYRPDLGEAWLTSRLFYNSLPESHFRSMRHRYVAHGLDTTELDGWFENRTAGFWPDSAVDLIMDISHVIDIKLKAIQCHQTQIAPDNLFFQLPELALREQWSHEYFSLAWPPINHSLRDLFDGLE